MNTTTTPVILCLVFTSQISLGFTSIGYSYLRENCDPGNGELESMKVEAKLRAGQRAIEVCHNSKVKESSDWIISESCRQHYGRDYEVIAENKFFCGESPPELTCEIVESSGLFLSYNVPPTAGARTSFEIQNLVLMEGIEYLNKLESSYVSFANKMKLVNQRDKVWKFSSVINGFGVEIDFFKKSGVDIDVWLKHVYKNESSYLLMKCAQG